MTTAQRHGAGEGKPTATTPDAAEEWLEVCVYLRGGAVMEFVAPAYWLRQLCDGYKAHAAKPAGGRTVMSNAGGGVVIDFGEVIGWVAVPWTQPTTTAAKKREESPT